MAQKTIPQPDITLPGDPLDRMTEPLPMTIEPDDFD